MNKKITVLKPEIKDQILEKRTLRIALFELWQITDTRTLKTWIAEDNPKLTQLDSLKVIKAYLGFPTEELTTEVEKSLV